MADPGPNPRPGGGRPGPHSPSGTDPKRPRTALPDRATTLSGSQENPHDLDSILQFRNLNPLDQRSSSIHTNGNPEAIRPHSARGTLVPEHMLPRTFDFFLAPGVRESIARQNEARLGMMIERIQRGQVEDFVFDRRQLVWTWEGMQDDFVRAAHEGQITALNQSAQMITESPYDSDDRSSEGSPAPEEVPAPDAVPRHVIDAMKEAVAQCSVIAVDWNDVTPLVDPPPLVN